MLNQYCKTTTASGDFRLPCNGGWMSGKWTFSNDKMILFDIYLWDSHNANYLLPYVGIINDRIRVITETQFHGANAYFYQLLEIELPKVYKKIIKGLNPEPKPMPNRKQRKLRLR